MKNIKSVLLTIISILTGLIFCYSAYTKLYSLESFERFQYTMVEYVHLPWTLALIGSRVLTGMEAALGLMFLLNIYGHRKWILKIALVLLAMFSIYLVYLWIAVGNDVNCGCFGDEIAMSPSSSLLKNIGLALIIIILIRYHKGLQINRFKWVIPITFIGLSVSTFAAYPPPDTNPSWLNKDKYKIDLHALYAKGKSDAPSIDLYKGKYVIAFFSLKCPHCKMAAYKMHIMKKNNPALPFYMVYAGNDKYLDAFWKATNAQNIPHSKLEADDFTAIAGFSWPAIFLVNNGWVEARTNYISMNQAEIEDWLKK